MRTDHLFPDLNRTGLDRKLRLVSIDLCPFRNTFNCVSLYNFYRIVKLSKLGESKCNGSKYYNVTYNFFQPYQVCLEWLPHFSAFSRNKCHILSTDNL